MSRKSWVGGRGSSSNSSRASRRKRNRTGSGRWAPAVLQQLESRLLLSVPPPAIDPTKGEAKLLSIIDSKVVRDIKSLENFPIPFALRTDWFGNPAAPLATPFSFATNSKDKKPTKVDVDNNKATGQGGFDIQVEVNPVMLPRPHLAMTITRLGAAPFVENFQVLISFPYKSFYSGPPVPGGSPNLFIGYRTQANGGQIGGHAPATEEIEFLTDNLANTAHGLNLALRTTGADNPLMILAGHFDGTFATGPLNVMGIALELETLAHRVPQQINVGLDVDDSQIGLSGGPFVPPTNIKFGINWQASERTKATFSYIESEDLHVADSDFATSVTVDQMPVQESFKFEYSNKNVVHIRHQGSSPIDRVQFRHQRRDGLLIKVDAQQVPTQIDMSAKLSLASDSAISLDVNANTMDLTMQAVQVGGFPDSDGLLGMNLGYIEFGVKDAVDMVAGYVASQPIIGALVDLNRDNRTDAADTGTLGGTRILSGLADLNADGHVDAVDTGVLFGFNVVAGKFDINKDGVGDSNDAGKITGILSAFPKNSGEVINSLELIADDDAHFVPNPADPTNRDADLLVGLALPPSWNAAPLHHEFSFIEDGTHGTAAARFVNFSQAVFQLNNKDLANAYHLVTGLPAPLQAYLQFTEQSKFLEGPNPDVLAVCDVNDLPAGEVKLHFTPPTDIGYEVIPPAPIASIHCFGHQGLSNFDMSVGGLPPVLAFHFDPAASFSLRAEDGHGGPARVNLLGLRISEAQVAIVGGSIDVDLNGRIDGQDDGTFLSFPVIDGKLDTSGDGLINDADVGLALTHIIKAGQIDVNNNGAIDSGDNASRTDLSQGLADSQKLFGIPLRDARLRVDDIPSLEGTWGNVTDIPFASASALPPRIGDVLLDTITGATAIVHKPAPATAVGFVSVVQARGDFAAGSPLRLLDRLNVKNVVGTFAVGQQVVGALSHAHAIISRVDQLGLNGTLYLSAGSGAFISGEELRVNNVPLGVADGAVQPGGAWTATTTAGIAPNGMSFNFGTIANDVFVGGVQVALSTQVELAPIDAPTPTTPHYLRITTHQSDVPSVFGSGKIELGVFAIDEVNLDVASGGMEAGYDAGGPRPARILLHRDVASDVPDEINAAIDIDNVPQSMTFRTNFASSVDYRASAAADSIHTFGYVGQANFDLAITHVPQSMAFEFEPGGTFAVVAQTGLGGPDTIERITAHLWETQVAYINGGVDINLDGKADADDDGLLLRYPVINGRLDMNGDGVVTNFDNGVVLGRQIIFGLVDINGNRFIDDGDDLSREQASPGLFDTAKLLGRPLRDARLRIDQVPSMNGSWGNVVDLPFGSANHGFAPPRPGDVIFDTGSGASATVRTPAPNTDDGNLQVEQVSHAAFGPGNQMVLLNRLDVGNLAGPFEFNETIVGATSGAQGIVGRADQIADHGTLYLHDRNASAFLPGELLLVDGLVRGIVVAGSPPASRWSAFAGTTSNLGLKVAAGTTAAGTFVPAVQLALATQVGLAPIPGPTPTSPHYLRVHVGDSTVPNRPAADSLEFGAFGIDEVSLETVNTGGYKAHFAADAQRQAHLSFQSGVGPFVPAAADVALDIDRVPQSLDISANLATLTVEYHASDPIDSIHAHGFIGLGNIDAAVSDLPQVLAFHVDAASSLTLHADDAFGNPATINQFLLHSWESQVSVTDGSVSVDGSSNGSLLGHALINGALDTNDDGAISADDIGAILGATVIAGRLDVNHDGHITGDDDATTHQTGGGLDGTDSLFGRPLRDIRIRIDDVPSLRGNWGPALTLQIENANGLSTPRAGKAVWDVDSGATGILLNDAHIATGKIEIAQARGDFAKHDLISLLDRVDFLDQTADFAVDEVIVGATSGTEATIRRIDQLGGRGTAFVSISNGRSFTVGETLIVNGVERATVQRRFENIWAGRASAKPKGAGSATSFGTEDENAFLGGVQLSVSTEVEIPDLPAPTLTSPYFLHVTDVSHSLSSTPVPARLSLGFFSIDDVSLVSGAGLEAHFDGNASRPLQLTIQTDFGSKLTTAQAVDLALNIFDVPQHLHLATDSASRLDYGAAANINSIALTGVIDGKDDGILNFRIINGLIDLNGDGADDDSDSGLIGDRIITSGKIDMNHDGLIDTADDGTLNGVPIIDGMLDVDENGVVNFKDDHDPNGMEVAFGMVNLPYEIHLRAAPGAVPVIGGLLDLKADGTIDDDDTGNFAGIRVIQGKIDINEDGVVDNDDDGELLGRQIINGQVDLDAGGVISDSDAGNWQGVEVHMSDQIQDIEVLLRSQSDELGLMGGENRIMHVQVHNLPANLLLASFGISQDLTANSSNGFAVEATDAQGDPAPLGSLSVLMAVTQDPQKLDELRKAFQQDDRGPAGAVLGENFDDQTASRINYSSYLQEIDARYFDAGHASSVLQRLAALYADGSILDTDQDHIAIRQAAGAGLLTDVLLHGFQTISGSWKIVDNPLDDLTGQTLPKVPDDAHLIFDAPAPGAHPLYFGLANSDGQVDTSDDGVLAGIAVRNGALDINDDGSFNEDDDGFRFGKKIIDGGIDFNNDLVVDDADDGMLRGIRVVNGLLDISESLVSLEIENIPDHLAADLVIANGHLAYIASSSPGDIDFYSGLIIITPDDRQAIRLRLFDTPSSVDIDWSVLQFNGLNADGGITVDASAEFEALFLFSLAVQGRFIGGFHLEDLQIGYHAGLFEFDVDESWPVTVGLTIINGRIDVDQDHDVDNQDDGTMNFGVDHILNGFVDKNNDGTIDDDDTGDVLMTFLRPGQLPSEELIHVVNGVLQTGNYDNVVFSIPLSWELLDVSIGIDNDPGDSNIAENVNKPSLGGFFNAYSQKSGAHELEPAGPLPQSLEYLPRISTVMDEFRFAKAQYKITLDPLTPNIPGTPLSSIIDIDSHDSIIFDAWLVDELDKTLSNGGLIDAIPDGVPGKDLIPRITFGLRLGLSYVNNDPLHLFPINGGQIAVTLDPNDPLVIIGFRLHSFDAHEDPFD